MNQLADQKADRIQGQTWAEQNGISYRLLGHKPKVLTAMDVVRRIVHGMFSKPRKVYPENVERIYEEREFISTLTYRLGIAICVICAFGMIGVLIYQWFFLPGSLK